MITRLTDELLQTMLLPSPAKDGDKEDRGRVLVVGSSTEVPGAAILSGVASLRAGAGKLQLAVPLSLADAIGVALPECACIRLNSDHRDRAALTKAAARADSVLVGPGLDADDRTKALTRGLLEAVQASFILDAGALRDVLTLREPMLKQALPVILTPHAGEMAALLGVTKDNVKAEPARFARELAIELRCVVALKGATTYIADPGGAMWENVEGSVGLGTCGSGDVLAGLIAGLVARGASPLVAALWGVFAHATAGARLSKRVAPLGFLAREIGDELPGVLAGLN
jgi:ADP-dependent NAD(P)H-hydrate dehydratase